MIFNLFLPSLVHLNSKFLSSPFSYSSSFWMAISKTRGFPGGSNRKESAFNVGDLGSLPGFGRPSGGWRGYPLQHSWASLVTHIVKNPPAMWETWVRSFVWEDALEEGMVTYSSVLAWRIPMDIGAYRLPAMRSQRVRQD